ncbi:YueI family protein [Sporosarcina cyprini]|uniref:YueI family protein n=1 Tax=Sporosarcina cyprini TaxID=2910523 RepID=UPI001EE04F12|nr:YueI family protein [Sporosarcina cyprini]MCG3086376.1 YueI family protein [Sporosarcina cyprini]
MSNNVDDYIQQGMYGHKETKRAERKKFLGTIRERIVIALTLGQVRERGIYKQVEESIKENKAAHLYLNGTINYAVLSKYTKIASKNNVLYTIVTNLEADTDIGLVLAYDHAIDKEEIFVEKKEPLPKTETKSKKGLAGFFKKLFQQG